MTERTDGRTPGAFGGAESHFAKPDDKITARALPLQGLLNIPLASEQKGAFLLAKGIFSGIYERAQSQLRGKKDVDTITRKRQRAADVATGLMDSIDAQTEANTVTDRLALNSCSAGAEVALLTHSAAMRATYRRHDSPIDGYLDMEDFDIAGAAGIRVGDVSIRAFHDQDRRKPLAVSSLVRFFIELRRIETDVPDDFLEKNNSYLATMYPQLNLLHLARASDLANAVINGAYNKAGVPEIDQTIARYPDAAPFSRRLFEKAEDFQERLFGVLTHPDHPDYDATKTVIMRFGNLSANLKNYLIFLLNLPNSPRDLRKLYRETLQIEEQGRDEAFYGMFNHWIRDYSDTVSAIVEIYTEDDVDEIFQAPAEPLIGEGVPTYKDFRKAVAAIIPNKESSVDEFEIAPDRLVDVTWGGIVTPHAAKVKFAKNKPMSFGIEFSYENTIGEDTVEEKKLIFTVDVRDLNKSEFDWNFMEDPDSQPMVPFSNAAKDVTLQVLGILSGQLAQAKADRLAARKAEETARVQTRSATTVWPAEAPTQSSPAQRRIRGGSSQEALAEAIVVEEQGRQRRINIPEEDAGLLDLMQSLPIEQLTHVRQGLEGYNQQGVGRFKMLRSLEGTKVFSLRIGNLRVLLREGEREGSINTYEIIAIGDRKQIYKRNNPMRR